MAKLIFLGTASSIPTKNRDNTSFLFIHKKETFLIDCPGAIIQKLIKVNINFKKLRNVIITHEHPDHIYGIISLIHTQGHFNKQLNIFSNIYSIRIIKKLVNIFKLNSRGFPKINYIDVFKAGASKAKAAYFFCRSGMRLLAVNNKHMRGSFGIEFNFDKKSLLYSSDTSFYPKLLRGVPNLSYLIHDCTASSSFFKKYPLLYKMHTQAKDLANYLKGKGSCKLIPVHFLLLKKDEEKKIRKELKSLGEKVIFVRDFQTLLL